MNKIQSLNLLKLIADLYGNISAPEQHTHPSSKAEPQSEPETNHSGDPQLELVH